MTGILIIWRFLTHECFLFCAVVFVEKIPAAGQHVRTEKQCLI